jgi:phosphatidylglycerophosphate synthase
MMKHELQVIAGLGCGILLIGFSLLGFAEGWRIAGQWLLQAGLIGEFVWLYAWRRLGLNRAGVGIPLYTNLGWGNRLTLLRGGLIALTGGFLFLNINVLLPAILYTLAALLDRLDGYAARSSKQVSLLGNELDITFDALGLLVAPLLAISLGKIHGSYLLLSIAYYVYQWALQRRRNRGLVVYALPPNPLRRTLAGFQMGFVAVALWPVLNPQLTIIASVAFMLPVLFGFTVDWGVVSGRLPPQAISNLDDWSRRFFQPGLRLLLALALLLFLAARDFGLFPLADITDYLSALGLLFSASLILLGFAGRFGALILIILLGWRYPIGDITIWGSLLIFTTSWILLLGTGRFSLWQWDDDWVQRYDGT